MKHKVFKGLGKVTCVVPLELIVISQFIMYVSLGCHCDNFMQQIYIMPCTYNKFPTPKAHIHPKFKQTPKTYNPITHMHKHLLRI